MKVELVKEKQKDEELKDCWKIIDGSKEIETFNPSDFENHFKVNHAEWLLAIEAIVNFENAHDELKVAFASFFD